MPHDVRFLDVNEDLNYDLEIKYAVNKNMASHARDWIGLYNVKIYL